jgi:hypothetical protein
MTNNRTTFEGIKYFGGMETHDRKIAMFRTLVLFSFTQNNGRRK